MRLETARRFALSLPEATEEPHFDLSSFRVRKKIFATVPVDGKHLHVYVDPGEGKALKAEVPDAFLDVVWGQRIVPDMVRVHLPKADRAQVCEVLEEAWRRRAPKKLVAEHDAR